MDVLPSALWHERTGMSAPPYPPRATLRLQFHRGFTLDDAVRIVDWAADLGISHIYASPLLTARAGSMHGYDTVDHASINPELGGEAALRRLVAALRAHSMGLILDIVPNHMAVGGHDNAWWLDVLELGRASPYAAFFDVAHDFRGCIAGRQAHLTVLLKQVSRARSSCGRPPA